MIQGKNLNSKILHSRLPFSSYHSWTQSGITVSLKDLDKHYEKDHRDVRTWLLVHHHLENIYYHQHCAWFSVRHWGDHDERIWTIALKLTISGEKDLLGKQQSRCCNSRVWDMRQARADRIRSGFPEEAILRLRVWWMRKSLPPAWVGWDRIIVLFFFPWKIYK